MEAKRKELLQNPELTKADTLISVIYLIDKVSAKLPEIRDKATELGLTKVKRWNLSDVLGKSVPLVVRGINGWEITPTGKERAIEILQINQKIKSAAVELRFHIAKIKNVKTVEFLEEAVGCLESKYYRAAVVLSWAGAMSVLHDEVVSNHLGQFNTNAIGRNSKWKLAKNSDDLGLMKEDDFLDVLQSISLIGKNVKQELKDNCLKLRNGCAHPNSLVIAESRVCSHLEILVLNIFSKFSS